MRWRWIILLPFVLIACKRKNQVPDDILPPSIMQAVLWDITRSDFFVADYVIRKDSSLNRRTESVKLYQQIFDLHHVTKESFEQSFRYYKDHPALLKAVIDTITAHANEAATQKIKATNAN